MKDEKPKPDSKKPAPEIEKFTEEEQKEIIAKLKSQLTLEDGESVLLYASIAKQSL